MGVVGDEIIEGKESYYNSNLTAVLEKLKWLTVRGCISYTRPQERKGNRGLDCL